MLLQKRHLVWLAILISLLIFCHKPSCAQEEPAAVSSPEIKQVTTEGVGAIMQGDEAMARDRAIDDGLRKAVEQAVGTLVESTTLVENFQLISDNIYTKSSGYIQKYNVINEGADGYLYKVTVEATVAMGNLQNDLDAIGMLLAKKHKPRIMVIIKEQNIGGYEQFLSGLSSTENTIIQKFSEKGFTFVDETTVRKTIKRDQAMQALEGNDQAAAALGQQYGAEVVIIGNAIANNSSTMSQLSDMKSVQANVSARAIKVDTGRILAAGNEHAAAVHLDEITAGSEAFKKASLKIAKSFIDQIIGQWSSDVSGTNMVEIVVSNVDYNKLKKFKSTLQNNIRGIQAIHQRSFAVGVAKLEVETESDAQSIADELSIKNFGTFKVSITGFTPNKLTLKLIDN